MYVSNCIVKNEGSNLLKLQYGLFKFKIFLASLILRIYMRNYRCQDIQTAIQSRNLLVPLDVLLVGATGTGKSTTLNAIFGSTVAKVGDGVDPETQQISSYRANDYFRIHDSAGLGDGKEADLHHSKNITSKLMQKCTVNGQSYGFIDIALILLDGGSRDMGTAFRLLETVVLKSISQDRVIVAINQADMAMKGRGWDNNKMRPEQTLLDFLEEKSFSTQKRIKDSTGLSIKKPICYSAKYNYNIGSLIDRVIEQLPNERRLV